MRAGYQWGVDLARLPAEVVTPRMTLRQWSPADAGNLSAAVTTSLDHLCPWMWWAAHEPLDLAARTAQLEAFERDWAAGGDAVYGMFEHGEVVGGCGLHRRRGPGVLEIGYRVHASHLRRGLATEASRSLTDAAFTAPDIERVEIHHDRANVRSRAVPASLGFTFVGEAADGAKAPSEEGVDCTWSITATEWAARSTRRD